MDDFFARIGISRAVLVDDVALKEAWHRAAAGSAENGEEINRAYAVLRDPAKRIEHLLALHGRTAVNGEKPGTTLFDLFFTVAAALKKADDVTASIANAATALQRAGLTGTLLGSLDELTLANRAISQQKESRSTHLQSVADAFPNLSDSQWETLGALSNDFAFLTKWEGEIRKRETRLQEMLIGQMG